MRGQPLDANFYAQSLTLKMEIDVMSKSRSKHRVDEATSTKCDQNAKHIHHARPPVQRV